MRLSNASSSHRWNFGSIAPVLANVSPNNECTPLCLRGTQIFFVQQRLRDVEHRIVGTPGGEIGIVVIEKIFGGAERAARLVEQLLRLDLHAAMASSRALRRNGLCPCSQRSEE